MKTRWAPMALLVVLSAALVFVVAFWEPLPPRAVTAIQSHSRLPPASSPAAGDFTLQGPQGPVALADYRGQVVLIYFGYTSCPDVCPTSLALVAQALSGLTEAEAKRVRAIFISLDPERDSTAVLREYAPFFHPAIVGLSGTPEEIATLAKQYGVSYRKQPANAEGQYTIDHSTETYVVDSRGRLATRLPYATPASEILAAIRQQLARRDPA
ncbi:SCO family protein [Candidatus Accumulibacter sp. ACC003]|uniref:SCO family protein n=1 Tax=Candidatus Accumulibacter sp. ACC003 TaxID=2823334 RepID=UPI0025B89F53|nr:SCO family protein [Candidatus Accumulibacter sp. ACC003]